MAEALDEQSGTLTSGKVAKGGFSGPYQAEVYGKFARNEIREETVYGDSGDITLLLCGQSPHQGASPKVDGLGAPHG